MTKIVQPEQTRRRLDSKIFDKSNKSVIEVSINNTDKNVGFNRVIKYDDVDYIDVTVNSNDTINISGDSCLIAGDVDVITRHNPVKTLMMMSINSIIDNSCCKSTAVINIDIKRPIDNAVNYDNINEYVKTPFNNINLYGVDRVIESVHYDDITISVQIELIKSVLKHQLVKFSIGFDHYELNLLHYYNGEFVDTAIQSLKSVNSYADVNIEKLQSLPVQASRLNVKDVLSDINDHKSVLDIFNNGTYEDVSPDNVFVQFIRSVHMISVTSNGVINKVKGLYITDSANKFIVNNTDTPQRISLIKYYGNQ